MDIEDIKEILERGGKIYYAYFWIENFRGSSRFGETNLYFLTPDSKPKFRLTIKENKDLELIKEIDKSKIYKYYTRTESERYGGYEYYKASGIAFSTEPFLLYIRYRSETPERIDDKDELREAKEITNIEELDKLI